MSIDPRLSVLLGPASAEVFHGVESGQDVFRADPFDVPAIHAQPRRSFDLLVEQARARRSDEGSGRMLLLLGEAGSGKTHLIRAFRQDVHRRQAGFVSYAQLTSSTTNYPRYLLRQVLESLERPYDTNVDPDRSALDVLSDELCDIEGACLAEERRILRETDDDAELRKHAWKVGNRLIARRLVRADSAVDQEVVFQLLFLQNCRPTVARAVVRYLSCAVLGARETALLGGVAALDADEDPLAVLRALARMVAALHGGAFVLCIDQLEDAYAAEESSRQSFRRMMLAVREMTDSLANAVVVITCLSDYWEAVKGTVSQSILDRLILDPAPMVLSAKRSAEETRSVVAARVAHALRRAGMEPDAADPTSPFRAQQLERFSGMRLRDLLAACARVLELARQRGEVRLDFSWLEEGTGTPANAMGAGEPEALSAQTSSQSPRDEEGLAHWARAWNDFCSEFEAEIPDEEDALAALLAKSLLAAHKEFGEGSVLNARCMANHVLVEAGSKSFRIGICEKQSRGGGLQRQLNQLWNKAVDRVALIVRSTPFPTNPSTKIAQTLGEFVAAGHLRVVCPTSDWRAMLAMIEFASREGEREGFVAWRAAARPILSLRVFEALSGARSAAPRSASLPERASLDSPASHPPAEEARAEPAVSPPRRPANELSSRAALTLGKGGGVRASPVELELQDLCRHAAFLGATGSGKTTLAMSLIEKALLHGVPTLLVDRKGDLASYADPASWNLAREQYGERAEALHAAIDVQVYTPGDPSGRDLALPILPATAGLAVHERQALVDNSANALVAMLNPGRPDSKPFRQATAILIAALALLDELKPEVTLADLIALLAEPDLALSERTGAIDPKALPKLGSDLESLKVTERQLLDNGAAERLDVEEMLGLKEGDSVRTRLVILNTGALSHEARVQFLVTRLLSDLRRVAERRPSESLQALVLLDEADLYLPASRRPPTKDPLEHGLKRFRSAGLGLLLATQSPGDLDYKGRENIGTWFVGRVTQDTALKKLEALFGTHRTSLARVSAQQTGEFYCLQAGRVSSLVAERSLITPTQMPPARIAELARAGLRSQRTSSGR